MWNKNYNKISNDNPKHYFHYFFKLIIGIIHLNARVVFPLNGYKGQCTEVQSFGCVSYPKHSVQNALMANERVSSTFFNFPDLLRIVCFVAIVVIHVLQRECETLYTIIYEIIGVLSREIFSHPKSLFLLKLGHIDVSHCFYWSYVISNGRIYLL